MAARCEGLILGSRALLCALLALGLLRAAGGRKLRFVNLVYRHGDRSPIGTYPTDPYTEKDWPQGFGQLTQVGMRQHYELGQYLRHRYKDFLNSSYDRQEIYVRSTDIDRTLMSAEVDLAALYAPQGHQVFHPDLNWQPIPVHTVPVKEDKLLLFPLNNCPRFDELEIETTNCSIYRNKTRENLDFLKMLADKTGIPHLQMSLEYVWMIYDSLFCEQTHNFTLPHWVTPEVMEHLRELKEFSAEAMFGLYKPQEKYRLQGGVLLNQILQDINQATNESAPTPRLKMIMYSAHDTTIIALQMALNVYSLTPPYAACHMFELYQENDGSFSLEMYFRNETTADPHLLTLPSCTERCSLPEFIRITSRVITNNWEEECQSHSGRTQIELILGLAVGSCLLLLLVALSLKLWCRGMGPSHGYQQLSSHSEESGK